MSEYQHIKLSYRQGACGFPQIQPKAARLRQIAFNRGSVEFSDNDYCCKIGVSPSVALRKFVVRQGLQGMREPRVLRRRQ